MTASGNTTTPGDTTPENTTPPLVEDAGNVTPSPDRETLEGLRRERNTAREQLAQAQARVQELEATMDATKQTELEQQLAEARAENERLKGEQTTAQRRAALDGKVANVDLALRALDPAKHLDKDGNVKVEALLADFPQLSTTAATAATAPDGGGGTQSAAGTLDLDAAVNSKDTAAINAAFDEALKGGNK